MSQWLGSFLLPHGGRARPAELALHPARAGPQTRHRRWEKILRWFAPRDNQGKSCLDNQGSLRPEGPEAGLSISTLLSPQRRTVWRPQGSKVLTATPGTHFSPYCMGTGAVKLLEAGPPPQHPLAGPGEPLSRHRRCLECKPLNSRSKVAVVKAGDVPAATPDLNGTCYVGTRLALVSTTPLPWKTSAAPFASP